MQTGTFVHLATKVLRRTATESLLLGTGIDLTKPNDIRAILTERCNYRCRYCNHWRRESYAEEMSLEEWQKALLSIRQFVGRFAVQFLGGEPMLVPWFLDLATFCGANDIDWGVITNGSSLSAARVSRLVAANPLNVDISLDSLDAAAHDFLRGIPGSMDKVRAGIERLVAARQRAGSDFSIRLKPTVTRQTIASLGDLVSWAETMPSVTVDFSPVRLRRPVDIAEMYPSDPEELVALKAQIDTLVERKRAGAPIETSVAKLRAMLPRFAHQPVVHGVATCRVSLRTIDIGPDGDVSHCFKFMRIGNLRHSTMEAIWRDAARSDMIEQSLGCDLIQTTCSTSCKSHRTALQDAVRGLRSLRTTSSR